MGGDPLGEPVLAQRGEQRRGGGRIRGELGTRGVDRDGRQAEADGLDGPQLRRQRQQVEQRSAGEADRDVRGHLGQQPRQPHRVGQRAPLVDPPQQGRTPSSASVRSRSTG
ncbi:hypothetical protein [Micromonospora sp. NPDC048830]|uniref:hypothetical protein n=1 Tax=Micromonospora sp. NPDC048830 TaxID=3364257 RepID=UPI0037203777